MKYLVLIIAVLVLAASSIAVTPTPCAADSFDRNQCLEDCKYQYFGRAGRFMYMRCIDECEQRFWADFDRRHGSSDQGADTPWSTDPQWR